MVAIAETNGKHVETSSQEVMADLEAQLTSGYRASLPIDGMFGADGVPMMTWTRDIEYMLRHPVVRQALGYFKGGVAGAEFWGGPNPDDPEDEQGLPVCPENDQVGRFIKEQCERFWDRGVPHIQSSYEYGWIGCENIYDRSSGILKWDGLFALSPRDTFLLTQDFKPVGVRVKNVQNSDRTVDLWMAGENVPAKGLWYAHQPRYNSFYGQSQLIGSWRPWRRAAWKDGAESVLDMACYRFGVGFVTARYPNEDLQGPNPGAPNTTLDSQGNPRRFARDIMRQLGEQAKAGAVIGLSSKRDASGNYVYDLEWPTGTLAGLNNLIDYLTHLYNQITQGIGVPPELLEAAESGSGYSGRRIPLEAFLANQQQIADAMLKMFVDQVLKPMIRYNFGDVKWNVQVKSLIKTRTKAAQAGQGIDQNRSEAAKQAWATRRAGQSQPPQQVDEQPPQHQNPGQAMFSHSPLVTDRIRDIARKIVRAA